MDRRSGNIGAEAQQKNTGVRQNNRQDRRIRTAEYWAGGWPNIGQEDSKTLYL
jgi:hypothetical protein